MSITRKCRATGTDIEVATAAEAGVAPDDSPELKWYTICWGHSTLVGHTTKALAISHAAWPAWCEECQAIMQAKGLFDNEG